VIIFGYRAGKRRDFGEALPIRCPQCNTASFYRYVSVTSWLTLFFIPLIPLNRRDYLVCPICSRAIGVRRDQREVGARIVELTARFRAGSIAGADYESQVRAVASSGGMGQGTMPEGASIPLPPPPP
jgi:hypothetical protein